MSFSSSVLLSGHPGHVNRNYRLLAYHPTVVPRRDYVCVTRAKLFLCAIVHLDMQPTRDLVAGVQHLATLSARYGLDVL